MCLVPCHRIAVALYAQFGSGKFPACWWTVFACVASYALLTIALNVYTAHFEGEAFLVTKPRRVSNVKSHLRSLHVCTVYNGAHMLQYTGQASLRGLVQELQLLQVGFIQLFF